VFPRHHKSLPYLSILKVLNVLKNTEMLNTHKKRKTCRFTIRNEEDEEDEDASADKDLLNTVDNKIFFYCNVTKKTILKLVESLKKATDFALKNEKDEVCLYIHSSGGDAFAGLSGLMHIEQNKVDVVCIVDGFVASAATFLLLGAKKRLGTKYSNILIHQITTGFWGKYSDMVDEMQNSNNLMTCIKHLYKEKTNIGENLDSIITKEINITAENALRWGLLTSLI